MFLIRQTGTLARACVAATILACGPAAAMPVGNLVGLYMFDDGTARDSSGNANHGVVGSAVGFTAPGGGVDGAIAADFSILTTGPTPSANAVNSVVVPIDINFSNMPELTMGAWVRLDSTGQGGMGKVLSHDNGGFDRTLGTDIRGANSGTGHALFTGAFVQDSPSDLVTLGAWQFVAARYDGVTARLTVDDAHYSTTDFTADNIGLAELFIGANPHFNEDFDGLIDNVFVYSRVLSDAELDELRINGVTPVPVPGALVLFFSCLGVLGRRLPFRSQGRQEGRPAVRGAI